MERGLELAVRRQRGRPPRRARGHRLLIGAVLLAGPALAPAAAAGRARDWLLGGGLAAGAVALATTKIPTDAGDGWGRTIFETGGWMAHLAGGAIWLGGLAGLLLLALPGGVADVARGRFWSVAIRRFSVAAMSSVAAIALSGLFLYWEHVDGPRQLLTTMYGRVLGVKILIFGTLLLLVMTVLFVAPFLHGSARNQAFQADAAAHATSATAKLPKIAPKEVSASTWAWGSAETIAVIAVMIAGYRVSGRLARSRSAAAARPLGGPEPRPRRPRRRVALRPAAKAARRGATAPAGRPALVGHNRPHGF